MSDTETKVIGVGMISAVGLNALQTYASVKAGISRFAETSIYDKNYNPFVMSLLPDDVLPPLEQAIESDASLTSRQVRMLRLATNPLQDAAKDLPKGEKLTIFLAVPEEIPGRPAPINSDFIEHLCTQTKIALAPESSQLFFEGRSGGLSAMKAALDYLATSEEQHVLIGGIDSYLDLYLLASLDMESRILSTTTMDGFVPGEGAAFILLSKAQTSDITEQTTYAVIKSAGISFEKGHLYSEEAYKGDGLAQAFAIMFEEYKAQEKVQSVYAGLNGENFGSKEWGVAYLRNKAHFEEQYQIEHPIDCLGDTGAALAPMLMGLSAIGLWRKTTPGPSLIWCSSDYGQRAALILDQAN
ncbi:MAG: hypothetical protein MI976_17130 [Pseudomonadales bacterium]|nr:hypothetical protein [Pseudomonadales bacterium]